MRIVDFETADAACDGALSKRLGELVYDCEVVLLVDGDLTLDGDFTPAIRQAAPEDMDVDEVELYVVKGDLTVHGRIELLHEEPGLVVTGFTRAETIEGGDCAIFINDGEFDYFVYGDFYLGCLAGGEVKVPWVINSDHQIHISAPEAMTIENFGYGGRESREGDFNSENIAESFVPDVVSVDEGVKVDVDEFYKVLKAGKPVLRPGAMTAEQAAFAEVEKAFEARAEHLDLRESQLRRFPERICEMTWLRTLDLGWNKIDVIPESIGALRSLEVLRVDQRRLRALPEAIGQLESIEVLDVSSHHSGTGKKFRLPDSIAGLPRLRSIVADRTRLRFPEAMRGIASLRELRLRGSRLKKFPEAVATLTGLVTLDIADNGLVEPPGSIRDLVNLERLDLGGSLARLEAPVPDLSTLAALRVLEFSGRRPDIEGPYPGHDVVERLLTMTLPALETLSLDKWGMEKERGKQVRPPMPPEVIGGIGRFASLRRLNLSSNGLTSLPESFYTLTHLEEIDLRGNALPRAERERISAAFPKARIDFRDQNLGDAEQADKAEFLAAVQEANALRDAKRYDEALAKYEEALAEIARGSVDFAYNQLYCLYGIWWIYNEDVYLQPGMARIPRKFSAAEEAIALVPDTIFHFSDEGAFQYEVLRVCGNYVAWTLYEDAEGPDDPRLERALKIIDRSVDAVDGPEHHFIIDTKVRILLKMGCAEAAYRLVRKVLLAEPDFADFADIAADPRYLTWLDGTYRT